MIDRRFANDAIIDTVRRVALDGSARHAGFILPSIRDGLANGKSLDGLALVEAPWTRMCEGTPEDGSWIEANDSIRDTLTVKDNTARQTPAVWLASMYQNGVEATNRHYIGDK